MKNLPLYIALLTILIACNTYAQTAKSPTGSFSGYPNMDSIEKVCIGAKYLPFDVTTLDGKRLTNESCNGKVIFINFWFEACFPCRGEFGKLNELYDSLKDNPAYEFVAITFDRKETLPDFIQKTGIHYPIATVSDKVESKRLNYAMPYPSCIIVDKYGRIRYIAMKGISEKEDTYKVALQSVLTRMKKLL
jgi:cytochrome oxidase Cu insertion factor (SCO1/SenC/PrrC family)